MIPIRYVLFVILSIIFIYLIYQILNQYHKKNMHYSYININNDFNEDSNNYILDKNIILKLINQN